MEVRNSKFTQNYTKVFCEDTWKYNAPHHFSVETVDGRNIAHIDFQEGPIKECGINGVANEDLLLMVLTRLEAFQTSPCGMHQPDVMNLVVVKDKGLTPFDIK